MDLVAWRLLELSESLEELCIQLVAQPQREVLALMVLGKLAGLAEVQQFLGDTESTIDLRMCKQPLRHRQWCH